MSDALSREVSAVACLLAELERCGFRGKIELHFDGRGVKTMHRSENFSI